MIKVSTILENSTVRHNLLSQHGQSLLIEIDGNKILFDVGEIFEGFIYNLDKWNISLDQISTIVISHRHIDHIGSLTKLLSYFKHQKLLLPTQLGEPDMKKAGAKYCFLSSSNSLEYNVAIEPKLVEMVLKYPHAQIVEKSYEIAPNLWTTGCVGTKMQEQALVYDQKELGLSIIVGCSHPGLATFVDKAREITGNNKIRTIIGGFHFNPLTDEQVKEQANYLQTLGVECIFPNHCTGIKQTNLLKSYLTDKIMFSKTYSVGTGNSITIDADISLDFV